MKCRTRRRLLRIPAAVRYIDNVVSLGTFRNWIWEGRIPVVRIGRNVCVRTDVLDELIEGRASISRKSAA